MLPKSFVGTLQYTYVHTEGKSLTEVKVVSGTFEQNRKTLLKTLIDMSLIKGTETKLIWTNCNEDASFINWAFLRFLSKKVVFSFIFFLAIPNLYSTGELVSTCTIPVEDATKILKVLN